jgi:hypothetical protein
MLTGEIHSQIDSIWNDFWSGGASNPLSVVEIRNGTTQFLKGRTDAEVNEPEARQCCTADFRDLGGYNEIGQDEARGG